MSAKSLSRRVSPPEPQMPAMVPTVLPPLTVAIFKEDGTFLKLTALADPRGAFCNSFNNMSWSQCVAVPWPPAAARE